MYFTIESAQQAELKVKASQFIAKAIPITTKEHAFEELDRIRAAYYDANHHCFAYRLGAQGLEFRTADDGEPNGTAGKPILFALQKYGVSDTLLIVTRYFGGTKLGTGGLARAYNDSADTVLSMCTRKPVYRTTSLRVYCTYEDVKSILKLIDKFAISHEDEYHDAIEFRVRIPSAKTDVFIAEVTALTAGRAGCVLNLD